MGKYKSRATRLAEVVGELQQVQSQMEGLIPDNTLTIRAKAEAYNEIWSDVPAMSELEMLKDEMVSWRDNMDGTNLENTQKYEDVDTCADALEDAHNEMAETELTGYEVDKQRGTPLLMPALHEIIQETIDIIDSSVSDLESVIFPGAFGN